MFQQFPEGPEFLRAYGDDGALEEFVAVDEEPDFPGLPFGRDLDQRTAVTRETRARRRGVDCVDDRVALWMLLFGRLVDADLEIMLY